MQYVNCISISKSYLVLFQIRIHPTTEVIAAVGLDSKALILTKQVHLKLLLTQGRYKDICEQMGKKQWRWRCKTQKDEF